MTHWNTQRNPVLLLVCIGAIGGCSSSDTPREKPAPQLAPPSFAGFGDPAKCQAGCVELAATIARAELGLDPTQGSPGKAATASRLFDELKAESASSNRSVESVSVDAVLEGVKAGPMPPKVLVHENGHLHVLLGAIDVEGRLLCQVAHGGMPVSLLTKEQLGRAGFREAWRFTRRVEGVPIHVGSATLQIDKVCHNFGEVKPEQKLESVFSVKNTGAKRVVVDKPITSCQCTVPSLKEPKELAPGERLDIQILGQSRNAASQSDTVFLKFFEKGTGVSSRVALHLFASQRGSMKVTPERLDFGRVVPGKSYSRVVRLEEVPTDRFVLQGVDPGGLPMRHEIREVRGKDGLMAYVIHLNLVAPEGKPGKKADKLTLATDSHVRSQVIVPVQYEIPPRVAAVPSVISLGTVRVGETREERIRLVSQDSEPLTVTVLSAPAESAVRVEGTPSAPELVLTAQLKHPGVWQGAVKLKAQSASGGDDIEVKCAGFGIDEK